MQIVGAVINIILDPIFIFGYFGLPAMGTRGAAIATVAGQIIAMLLGLYFNLTKNTDVQFDFKCIKLESYYFKDLHCWNSNDYYAIYVQRYVFWH